MAIVEGNVDLFVLTVTAPEQQAAKKVIQKAAGKAMEKRDCLNTITKELAVVIHYVEWDDFFESKESGPAKIALACASEMGLESSAQGVVLISQTTLKPSVIVMVGICAGYEKGVNLGDVLVPFCITRASGKEYADKTFAASAKFTEIDLSLKKILTSEATSSKSSWGRFIPDDMTSTPSPVYLHDFILSKVRHRLPSSNLLSIFSYGLDTATWQNSIIWCRLPGNKEGKTRMDERSNFNPYSQRSGLQNPARNGRLCNF